MKLSRKKILRITMALAVAVCLVLVACYVVISINAGGKTYDDVALIPHNRVGLLLGTSPITRQGGRNFYFDNRIKATAALYHGGKINRIIVSGGDYSRDGGYNEPCAMRDSLIARGVPDSVIVLDAEGVRTLNSIVKAKNVYALDSVTVISQKYHNERALWLAEHHGLHAIAYNAGTPDITDKKIKNISREVLARVKMFIDMVVGVSPRFEAEK